MYNPKILFTTILLTGNYSQKRIPKPYIRNRLDWPMHLAALAGNQGSSPIEILTNQKQIPTAETIRSTMRIGWPSWKQLTKVPPPISGNAALKGSQRTSAKR